MRLQHIIILCFLSFTSWCYGQEEMRLGTIKNQLDLLKVELPGLSEATDISISDASLGNFMLALSKTHKLNLNVSPELNTINVVNDFTQVTVDEVLLFFAKEYNLDYEFTGNIISVKKYVAPAKEEEAVNVLFDPASKEISLDLNNDKLKKVFRAIMDASGKNLLFSRDIENIPLTLYIKNVPIEVALDKLASTNNLTLSVSRDGFYYFDSNAIDVSTSNGQNQTRTRSRRRGNFFYKVLDTVNRRLSVDFQNTSIADVVYTLSEDLKLGVFTATPLDNAGLATVKAENIEFDVLLDKIFQSAIKESPQASSDNRQRNNETPVEVFTYKREGNLYFFGTQGQLSLKQVEVVRFKRRAIIDFKDAVKTVQSSRNQNFTTGGSNVFGQNNNNPANNIANRSSGTIAPVESIEKIIPKDIKVGLDITTDYELNGFVVSGPGVLVERFKGFIEQIDVQVPLVFIKVMILEVDRTAILETGISFGIGDKPVKTRGDIFPSTNLTLGAETVNKVISGASGFGALNIGKVVPEFWLDIKANEENGNVKILSSPQLSALNGHSAYLSSSQTSYYAITNQTIIGSQNPQTTEIRNYAPISAELAVDIRPIVTDEGEITLDIKVIQSNFSGERIEADAPPDINAREFSSILRMKDKDVAVLGGIDQVVKDDSGSGVPFLARIPIIKYLFSKRRREDSKRSLTIFIQPTIIK